MHRFLKWRDSISMARDFPSLIQLMADYVQSIPAEQRARLPASCQQVLKHPSDVQGEGVAMRRVRMGLAVVVDARGAPLLPEIADSFARASFRAGQLNSRLGVGVDRGSLVVGRPEGGVLPGGPRSQNSPAMIRSASRA